LEKGNTGGVKKKQRGLGIYFAGDSKEKGKLPGARLGYGSLFVGGKNEGPSKILKKEKRVAVSGRGELELSAQTGKTGRVAKCHRHPSDLLLPRIKKTGFV